jgi:hypothetical protein
MVAGNRHDQRIGPQPAEKRVEEPVETAELIRAPVFVRSSEIRRRSGGPSRAAMARTLGSRVSCI